MSFQGKSESLPSVALLLGQSHRSYWQTHSQENRCRFQILWPTCRCCGQFLINENMDQRTVQRPFRQYFSNIVRKVASKQLFVFAEIRRFGDKLKVKIEATTHGIVENALPLLVSRYTVYHINIVYSIFV